jgi:hypothetical protein
VAIPLFLLSYAVLVEGEVEQLIRRHAPLPVDLVGSCARRSVTGDVVLSIAALPTRHVGEVPLHLRKGPRRSRTTARLTASSRLDQSGDLVATVPRAALPDGVWTLSVALPGERVRPLDARLLVQGRRPVVLLWGAVGKVSRPPEPKTSRTRRDQFVSAGSRVLDLSVRVLPPGRRTEARQAMRRVARKAAASAQ